MAMKGVSMKAYWLCQFLYLLLLSHSATPQPSAAKILLDWKASAASCSPTAVLPSWNETTPMSEWDGVTLAADGMTVTAVNVSNSSLCGNLPPSLAQLTGLTGFQASRNNLSGLLPEWCSQLTRLKTLSLASNQFTSTIPAAWSKLQALRGMHLGRNKLTGNLPPSFGMLTKLIEIGLEDNELTSTIPAAWSQLQALQWLSLHGNKLTGSLPPSFSELTILFLLRLDNNQLTSTIPAAWSKLQELQVLILGNNMLTGSFPTWVTTLNTNLKFLYLSNNQLTGPVPASLMTNGSLEYVDLSANAFTGPLPALSRQVLSANFSNNMFTGTVPSIPSEPLLVYLNLANNLLNSTIPAILAPKLAYLNLANNSFQALPPSLDAPQLQFLDMSNNKPNASLPAWTNHSMTYCDLSNNSLKGPLPRQWSNHNWSYLALDHNQLSGQLPPVWKGTVNVLLLQHNNFTGCIPHSWNNGGDGTDIIALSNNRLSGCSAELPEFKGMLSSLTLLDLDNTSISSRIPLSWVDGAAFGKSTLLNLGRLWVTSASEGGSWRKSVCIITAIQQRMQQQLDGQLVDSLKAGVKNKVNTALSSLTQLFEETGFTDNRYEVLLDISFHLPAEFSQPDVNDICGNQHAKLIVIVQWSVIAAIIFLLLVAYSLEVKYHLLSRKKTSSRSPDMVCLLQRVEPWRRVVQLLSGVGARLRFLVCLAFYWWDIALDIRVLLEVWQPGRWPGYVLLGICLLHYVLAAGWLACRWSTKTHQWWPLVATPLLVPVMPVVDTLVAVLLTIPERHLPAHLTHHVAEWERLFDMRDAMEVLLESIPTAVVQSVVFVIGNTPDVGLYLDDRLYLLSAVGSGVQILRLVAVVLVRAVREDVSPLYVLKDLLLNKTKAVETLPDSSAAKEVV